MAKDSKYNVSVDKPTCIGCGTCSALAAKTFKMNDAEQKAEVIDSEDWDDDETIKQAAESCPVFAIILKNKETGVQEFPEQSLVDSA